MMAEPAGISGVLHSSQGQFLFIFSMFIGVRDTNDVEILAILEAIRIYVSSFQESLIVESDYSNAISWNLGVVEGPWKVQYYY